MIREMGWFVRMLVALVSWARLSRSSGAGKGRMRQRALALSAGLLLVAIGMGAYTRYFRPAPSFIDAPVVPDNNAALPQSVEFEQLAKSDPVEMLHQCLVRYQREVKGFRGVLEKQECIKGKFSLREVIALSVRGDVPDPTTGKTRIEVLMKWQVGGQAVLGSEVKGTLYVEEKGGNKDSIITWRPTAPFRKEHAIDVNGPSAREASRYCIRDAGLYRGTLRTYEVWKQRKEEGILATEYLGRKPIEQAGGVECHIVKRICRSPEVDAFELGGTPDMSPETVAREGFAELTIMIDAKRWLQVGTELRRANGELIGAYYFRDIELNPAFPGETFTKDGLLKK